MLVLIHTNFSSTAGFLHLPVLCPIVNYLIFPEVQSAQYINIRSYEKKILEAEAEEKWLFF